MAHSKMSAEKFEDYSKTDYRFGQGSDAVTLRIDQQSDELARLYVSSSIAGSVFITTYLLR